MASKVADIVRQAAELESSERAEIITKLLKTLDPPGEDVADFQQAWNEELERRESEMESGKVTPVDWETLRTSLRR